MISQIFSSSYEKKFSIITQPFVLVASYKDLALKILIRIPLKT